MSTCKAELHISDDHGDNYATMHCQLDEGHELPHVEIFKRSGTEVTVTWYADERDVEVAPLQKLREALADVLNDDAETRARWEGYTAEDFAQHGLGPREGEDVPTWANRIRAEATQEDPGST